MWQCQLLLWITLRNFSPHPFLMTWILKDVKLPLILNSVPGVWFRKSRESILTIEFKKPRSWIKSEVFKYGWLWQGISWAAGTVDKCWSYFYRGMVSEVHITSILKTKKDLNYNSRWKDMKRCNSTYYVIVIEDTTVPGGLVIGNQIICFIGNAL